MFVRYRIWVVSLLMSLTLMTLLLRAQNPGRPVPAGEPLTPVPSEALPRTTEEHIRASAWWPTKPIDQPREYVGQAVCAECHADFAAEQSTSQMAHTLNPAKYSATLQQHLQDSFRSGPYVSTLRNSTSGVVLHVSDGSATQDATLEWAFGSGDVGQSYLWQNDGSFREARFNYFARINAFAPTPGRLHGTPASLSMAGGRRVENFEARTCFACHTTAMSSSVPLDTRSVVPGVHCEACHGPGAAHVAAARARKPTDAGQPWNRAILNPGRLAPTEAVDLCGSCHSTRWDVLQMGAVGVQTVRFPAYRLQGSRCWLSSGAPAKAGGSPQTSSPPTGQTGPQAGDARLTCFSCHDPHAPLDRVAADYDSGCLSCHRTQKQAVAAVASLPGRACPVATTRCTTCHMPKVELPEMHSSFTDHRIRVARANEPFPDTVAAN